MRIIITSNTLEYGGAERQRVALANGLARLGHFVTVALIQADGPLADELDPAVQVSRFFAHKGQLPRADAVVTGMTNTEAGYAVLHKLAGIGRGPAWIAASHSWPPGDGPIYGRPLRGTVRVLSSAVVALTPDHGRALCARDGLCRNLHVISNGTTLPVSRRTARPTRDVFTFGFVGRIEPIKGLDRLLDALTALEADRDWQLKVFGEGSERDRLAHAAERAGLPVVWAGVTSDVAAALDEVDLLVLPSRSEAAPMVMLEAAARGVPVVATEVGAVPELLQHGVQGTLLDARESRWPGQLREAMKRPPVDRAVPLPFPWSSELMIERYEELLLGLAQHVQPPRGGGALPA